MAVSLLQTTQIVSGLSVILAHGNYAGTDIKSLEWWWELCHKSEQMRPMLTLRDGHYLILRATLLRHAWLEPCARTNRFLAIGSRTIWDSVVNRTQKDCYGRPQLKKTGQERSQAVERALFRWTDARSTGWFPFHGVTKTSRVREKGSDNEARCYSADTVWLFEYLLIDD